MRSLLIVRRAAAAAMVMAGLAACGGAQPGSQALPSAGRTATVTHSAAPSSTTPSPRSSPHSPA